MDPIGGTYSAPPNPLAAGERQPRSRPFVSRASALRPRLCPLVSRFLDTPHHSPGLMDYSYMCHSASTECISIDTTNYDYAGDAQRPQSKVRSTSQLSQAIEYTILWVRCCCESRLNNSDRLMQTALVDYNCAPTLIEQTFAAYCFTT